ncbi:hypothetical protein [Kitasatospora aureofaciens]|uniref:hypothetical protein n=1 Tax=Kitasatospora aureofaciens TaxID=1894 RepID=UPI0036F495BD
MTETVPPPLGASPTARPVTQPDHVLRRYDALREHSGFTARVPPGTLAATHGDSTLATGAARVQLPAHAPFTVLRRAGDLLRDRRSHIRAGRSRQHGGRVGLEAVHVFDAGPRH